MSEITTKKEVKAHLKALDAMHAYHADAASLCSAEAYRLHHSSDWLIPDRRQRLSDALIVERQYEFEHNVALEAIRVAIDDKLAILRTLVSGE